MYQKIDEFNKFEIEIYKNSTTFLNYEHLNKQLNSFIKKMCCIIQKSINLRLIIFAGSLLIILYDGISRRPSECQESLIKTHSDPPLVKKYFAKLKRTLRV